LGCPRLGRPARAFSNAIEMKEEHHVEVRKAMVKIKGKTMKDNVFDRFDCVVCPQSAMALYIYREERSCHITS